MKKTTLLSFVAALSLALSAKATGFSAEFMSNLQERIVNVSAMPKGEKQAANVVLIMSDIFGYTCQVSGQFAGLISGSPGTAYANADDLYRRYNTWTNPRVANEVRQLREGMVQYQQAIGELVAATQQFQDGVSQTAEALSESGDRIKSEYARRPIGPIATNVVDWGRSLMAGSARMAQLLDARNQKLLQYISAIDNNRSPGNLGAELDQIDAQLKNFQPIAGYSYAQVEQIFATNSSNIRRQYSGLY